MGRIIAVGDRSQAIYGFRGAHSASMDEIEKRFQCRTLPLSVSYRCPQAVVMKAREWVERIEWGPDAEWGYVGEEGTDWRGQAQLSSAPAVGEKCVRCDCTYTADMKEYCKDCPCGCSGCQYPSSVSKWRGLGDFSPGDAILCRLTRPLVEVAFALVRERKPVRMAGREIGKGLVGLCDKVARKDRSLDLQRFADDLDEYWNAQRAELAAKRKFAELGNLEDKIMTIRVFMEGSEYGDIAGHVRGGNMGSAPETVGDMIEQIERLFSDNGDKERTITLSTIHRAKGLEWSRVFVLNASELMPFKWARQDWELSQERNLCYVAATRARRELRYITSRDLGLGGD